MGPKEETVGLHLPEPMQGCMEMVTHCSRGWGQAGLRAWSAGSRVVCDTHLPCSLYSLSPMAGLPNTSLWQSLYTPVILTQMLLLLMFSYFSCVPIFRLLDCSTSGSPVPPLSLRVYIHSVTNASNHLIVCCSSPSCRPIFPSIRAFPMDCFLTSGCPEFWSFTLSMSTSNEY